MTSFVIRPSRVGAVAVAFVAATYLGSAVQAEERAMRYGREARTSVPGVDRDPEKPLSEEERIHHVLSRFAFGAKPGLVEEIKAQGLEKWFKQQIKADAADPEALKNHLAKYETLAMNDQQIMEVYRPRLQSFAKKLTPEEMAERRRMRQMEYVPRDELRDATLLRDIYSDNQLLEVTADFWRSHFNIDVSKGTVRYYATQYDREIIRGEALGSFERMLNKVARDPAMLVYLDNYISRATPQAEMERAGREALMQSRDYATALQAVDIARMRGLNENFARELMELHTLGVDNYYTQKDVVTVAEAITGWTVQQNPEKSISFQFRPDMHQSATRQVLGYTIPANPANPEMEGQAVLNLLAHHQGTAQFIAYKLCRYFVDDNPPPAMVARVATKYRQSKGDLPSMYLAILHDQDFFKPIYFQSKFKRPLEFLISALRITNAEVGSTKELHNQLLVMGEPIYQCEDPTGYYDQADAWRDPGIMATRWQFGLGLAMGWFQGVRIPDSYWEGLEPNNPKQWKEALAARILPAGLSKKTDEALDKVIARMVPYNPQPDQMGRYIVGILLGSPEFQRQ